MRCLLLILLFGAKLSISQDNLVDFKAEIQGTWWLNTVQAENFGDNTSDEIMSWTSSEYALIITKDSLFFQNPELRFYKRPDDGFTYSISYDSLFKSSILQLYKGKGKHKTKAGFYNFRLTGGKLILSSFCVPDPNFDMISQTNYYTYSRFKDEEKLYEKISGAWIIKNHSPLGSHHSDTINYTRKSELDTFTGIEVLFKTVHGEPRMSYSYTYTLSSGSDDVYDGVYAYSDCSIEIIPDQKKLLVGDGGSMTIFKIIELTAEKMILLRCTTD